MTVKDLFGKDGPLKNFKALHSSTLSKVKGERVGVDLSIFLYQWCSLDEYAIPATTIPRYDSQVLEDQVDRFDNALRQIFDYVVYVYEGKDLPLKSATKLERLKKIVQSREKLDKLISKQDSGQPLTEDELGSVKKLRRSMSAPDEIAYGKVIRHMKNRGMNIFGAPGKAEHQLVELQNCGLISTILTKDADLIPLHATHVIYDLRLNHLQVGQSAVAVYDRRVILSHDTEFKDMYLFKDYLPELASLLGTDYCPRVSGFGPKKVIPFMKAYIECNTSGERNAMLLQLESKGVVQAPQKIAQPIRDDYVRSADRKCFIASLDRMTKSRITKINESFIGWSERFDPAAGMFRHCPVFKISGDSIDLSKLDSFDVTLAPLYPLPTGCSWESMLGFDPFSLIGVVDRAEAKSIISLDCLLRFDRRPPKTISNPTYSAAENPNVRTTQALPRYARLDFDMCPVEVQPIDILLAWLSARGVHVLSDDRGDVESCVARARRLETEVMEPELQPKDNPYHWFDVLRPKARGNKYDHWSSDWIDLLPRLKLIDDAEFTRIFGQGANGVRERARGLLFDGNVMMKGIECINVQSSSQKDTAELILFRTRVCPSMKTADGKSKKHLFYHVHLCAEVGSEEGTGFFRSCPFSVCSCENGCFFCSHRQSFVLGLAIAQKYLINGNIESLMNYFKAKEDPRLSQGKAILLENYTLRAPSEKSQAIRKRKRSSKDDNRTPTKTKKHKHIVVTP